MSLRTSEQRLMMFSGLWILGILIFFTLSATRLPHYIFPLYPAAAMMVALVWERSLKEVTPNGMTVTRRLLLGTGYTFGLALAAGPAIYSTFVEKMTKEFPAASQMEVQYIPVILGLIIIIGTMTVRYCLEDQQKRLYGFGVAGGMMAAFVLIVVSFALPKFSHFFIDPPQELARIAGLNLTKDDRLIQFGRKRPSLTFYAQRKIYQINPGEDEKFKPHVSTPGRTMIILQSHLRGRLPESVSHYPVILENNGFSLLASESLLK